MIDLERKIPPAFKEIEKVEILRAQKNYLSNGIPVYTVNAGTEEVIKIDLLFKAGTYASFHDNYNTFRGTPLLASTVNHLIPDGTGRYTSAEIAENIDFYGAFIQTDCDKDIASVTLITLNKHLTNTLSWLEHIIREASFPEQEVQTYLQNTKQKFIVESEKVNVIARRKFNETIFGKTHPYGKNVESEDFETLKREALQDFFKRNYSSSGCQIIVSGKIQDGILSLLEKHFGNWDSEKETGTSEEPKPFHIKSANDKKIFVERKGQLQSAIRIGRALFSKNHPDYHAMKVMNVLLGGYFGSRLMANIREDKGYTYGIGSAVFPLVHGGCFFISTEVGRDVTTNALKETYFELAQMREKEVTMDELQKVRNYMLGDFIRSVDGPFSLAERLKGLLIYGLDYDYYDNFISAIRHTSPLELKSLAQKYLKEDDLYEVVVGSRS